MSDKLGGSALEIQLPVCVYICSVFLKSDQFKSLRSRQFQTQVKEN